MATSGLAGWYGKLPGLGDFASRRLPPLFIEPWDRWLASGLAEWRAGDETWLDAFLAAPTFRFALGAGVPFEKSPGYAGVLMPSVDRVGRYFPLTVVRLRSPDELHLPTPWLQAAEGCAVAALEGDWEAERFDAELALLDGQADDDNASWIDWPEPGQAMWWCERDGEVQPSITTAGLPRGHGFVRLLGGQL